MFFEYSGSSNPRVMGSAFVVTLPPVHGQNDHQANAAIRTRSRSSRGTVLTAGWQKDEDGSECMSEERDEGSRQSHGPGTGWQ
jgi:hypothetical protein